MDTSLGRDRRPVAVVVTVDGRRVQMPVGAPDTIEANLLSLIRSLLVGLEGVLGLITGRGEGGIRRDERR